MKYTFGFSAGARPRIAIAMAWAILAVGTVLLLDRQTFTQTTPARGLQSSSVRSTIAEGQVELQLAAGYRVAEWRVIIGSQEIEPDVTDAGMWKAVIERPKGEDRFEIMIEAQAEDHFADHRHALLITLRDGERRAERTIWGDGDITTLIDVQQWLGE